MKTETRRHKKREREFGNKERELAGVHRSREYILRAKRERP